MLEREAVEREAVEREIRACLARGDPGGAATAALRGHGAEIYWDGQYFSTISLYAPDNEYRYEFTFYDMPAGVHTVMVKVLNQKEPASGGTYVNLDYFRQYDF